MLKQADVVMAMFLLGNEFTIEEKRRNFDYYDPITTGDSSLSASIQCIVASEIGNEHAACRYLDLALLMDLADVAGNVSQGVHIASAAGAWMGLVFGFGASATSDGQLTFDPQLPQRFRSLGFSLRFHDRQLRPARPRRRALRADGRRTTRDRHPRQTAPAHHRGRRRSRPTDNGVNPVSVNQSEHSPMCEQPDQFFDVMATPSAPPHPRPIEPRTAVHLPLHAVIPSGQGIPQSGDTDEVR